MMLANVLVSTAALPPASESAQSRSDVLDLKLTTTS